VGVLWLLTHYLDNDFPGFGKVKFHKEDTLPVPEGQLPVDDRDHFTAAQRQVLAVCVTIRALVLVHVHGTDSEIVVPVVRVLWSDGTQKVLHIFDEQGFVLVDLDRRCGVARENDRYSGVYF